MASTTTTKTADRWGRPAYRVGDFFVRRVHIHDGLGMPGCFPLWTRWIAVHDGHLETGSFETLREAQSWIDAYHRRNGHTPGETS